MKPYPQKVAIVFLLALSLFSMSGCSNATVDEIPSIKGTTEVAVAPTQPAQATTEKIDPNKQMAPADTLFINLQIVEEDLSSLARRLPPLSLPCSRSESEGGR